MECTNFRQQAESYLDDEINPAMKERLEIHLQECRLCHLNLEDLQAVRKALKITLPAAPSKLFDERMLKAFAERQKQPSNKKSFDWRSVFIPLFNPQLSGAFATGILVVGVFLAFQIGKLTATDIQIISAPTEAVSLPAPEITEKNPSSSATITKIVEVPVVKERVVTRVVYVDRNKENGVQTKRNTFESSSKSMTNNSIAESSYLTQARLNGFQPASEITATVIKGEK